MNTNKKITLKDIITKKQAIIDSKKTPKTAELYVKSLDGVITIKAPDAGVAQDAVGMDNGDVYAVYQCVIEPNLKDKALQSEFECVEPMDIVKALFNEGEIPQIAQEALKLAGYIDGVEKLKEIKN